MLIHKRILAALRFATCADDTRYHLHGYGLGTDGSICATDGHLMLYSEKPSECPPEDYPVLPTPIDAGTAVSQVLPVDAADAAVRTIKKGESIPALNHIAVVPADGNGHKRLRVAATDLSVAYDTLVRTEGTFPVWRKVIPTKAPKLTVCLGADLLIDLGRAAKAASKDAAVTFAFTGPDDPIRLTLPCEVGDEIRGVLMPRRQ